jgi:hypothetical protein
MKVGDLVEYVDNNPCPYQTFTTGISHGNLGLVISVLARDKTTVKVRWFYNGGIEFWLAPQRLKVLTKE